MWFLERILFTQSISLKHLLCAQYQGRHWENKAIGYEFCPWGASLTENKKRLPWEKGKNYLQLVRSEALQRGTSKLRCSLIRKRRSKLPGIAHFCISTYFLSHQTHKKQEGKGRLCSRINLQFQGKIGPTFLLVPVRWVWMGCSYPFIHRDSDIYPHKKSRFPPRLKW